MSTEHDDVQLRRVELEKDEVEGWEEYDRILFGYPIWWGKAAWPASSFVGENDFTGKNGLFFSPSGTKSKR